MFCGSSVGLQYEIVVFPDHTHLLLVTISVLWLILTVPWVGLRCVIVVFPDHTHLLFVTVGVLWLFLTVPWVFFLRCVSVVFPDHTRCLIALYIITYFNKCKQKSQ